MIDLINESKNMKIYAEILRIDDAGENVALEKKFCGLTSKNEEDGAKVLATSLKDLGYVKWGIEGECREGGSHMF
jgi:hypothetical protein